jgi:hypothetical protein
MLEAAKGLPDLLRARREAMEARWRGEMAARNGRLMAKEKREGAGGLSGPAICVHHGSW